jgi:hypothetical protein
VSNNSQCVSETWIVLSKVSAEQCRNVLNASEKAKGNNTSPSNTMEMTSLKVRFICYIFQMAMKEWLKWISELNSSSACTDQCQVSSDSLVL